MLGVETTTTQIQTRGKPKRKLNIWFWYPSCTWWWHPHREHVNIYTNTYMLQRVLYFLQGHSSCYSKNKSVYINSIHPDAYNVIILIEHIILSTALAQLPVVMLIRPAVMLIRPLGISKLHRCILTVLQTCSCARNGFGTDSSQFSPNYCGNSEMKWCLLCPCLCVCMCVCFSVHAFVFFWWVFLWSLAYIFV